MAALAYPRLCLSDSRSRQPRRDPPLGAKGIRRPRYRDRSEGVAIRAEKFPLKCPRCGGDIRLIAFTIESGSLCKIHTRSRADYCQSDTSEVPTTRLTILPGSSFLMPQCSRTIASKGSIGKALSASVAVASRFRQPTATQPSFWATNCSIGNGPAGASLSCNSSGSISTTS